MPVQVDFQRVDDELTLPVWRRHEDPEAGQLSPSGACR